VWFALSHAEQNTQRVWSLGTVWSTMAEQKANLDDDSGQTTLSPVSAS